MSVSTSTENITLQPMDLFYGNRNVDCVTAVADVASNLQSTYFEFETINFAGDTIVPYYVWMNVGAAGVDPTPAGKTGIEVAFAADSTALVVAAAIVAAVNGVVGIQAKAIDVGVGVVRLTNAAMGAINAAVDSSGAATGFAFASAIVGDKLAIGATSGGVTLSVEVTHVEVKTDQRGSSILDLIRNGESASVSGTFLEVSRTALVSLMGDVVGDTLVVGSETNVGIGVSKRFLNMTAFAKELQMKPSGSADDSENFTIWKALPVPTEFSFSGEDLKNVAFEFTSMIDELINEKVNLLDIGDSNNPDFHV